MKSRILPSFIFFISGASALSYEVIWSRTLQAIFSSNYQTAAAIFSAFLLGLALGAFIPRKFADKTKDQLFYISLLMLFVGIYGFLVAYLFVWIGSIAWIISASQIVKILTVFALILPASLCFGAVWPFIMSYLINNEKEIGKRIGNLYSLNSLGSGLGALLCGVAIIPILGFRGTSFLVATINIVVALILLNKHFKKFKS